MKKNRNPLGCIEPESHSVLLSRTWSNIAGRDITFLWYKKKKKKIRAKHWITLWIFWTFWVCVQSPPVWPLKLKYIDRLSFLWCKVVQTFESVKDALNCINSNEIVLLNSTVLSWEFSNWNLFCFQSQTLAPLGLKFIKSDTVPVSAFQTVV